MSVKDSHKQVMSPSLAEASDSATKNKRQGAFTTSHQSTAARESAVASPGRGKVNLDGMAGAQPEETAVRTGWIRAAKAQARTNGDAAGSGEDRASLRREDSRSASPAPRTEVAAGASSSNSANLLKSVPSGGTSGLAQYAVAAERARGGSPQGTEHEVGPLPLLHSEEEPEGSEEEDLDKARLDISFKNGTGGPKDHRSHTPDRRSQQRSERSTPDSAVAGSPEVAMLL